MESIQTEELFVRNIASNILHSMIAAHGSSELQFSEKLLQLYWVKLNTHKISQCYGKYPDRGGVCKRHGKQHFSFYDCCSQQFRAIVLRKACYNCIGRSLTPIKLPGVMESIQTEELFVRNIASNILHSMIAAHGSSERQFSEKLVTIVLGEVKHP